MTEQTPQKYISAQELDRLIAAHDGDVALLYLHRLRQGALDEERAASDLCRTMEQIRAAEEKLQRMEGAERAAATPPDRAAGKAEPAPAEELPQYTAAEIDRRTRGDEALQAVYAEAVQVLDHALTANDMRVLLGIYDHLGMPPEVMVELLHYCAEENQRKYKGDRRLTSAFIEKEAYAWANREILSLDQAEDYIRDQREKISELGRLRTALHLSALSATQEKDLRLWLEQGFGEEAILIAADRTVTNTGALKWSYLRKILQSWQEKGLHSPSEIEEKDPARSSRSAPPAKREERPMDPSVLRNILDKI